MTRSLLSSCLVIITFGLLLSCKKEADQQEEPDIVYPRTMHLVTVQPDGKPSLYSNGQTINDPVLADLFVAPALSDLGYFRPAKSVTFFSKDSMAFSYVTSLSTWKVNCGIQQSGNQYTFTVREGYPSHLHDTSLIAVVVNGSTGLIHSTYTASGDFNELKVAAFAYKIRQYEIYRGEPFFKYEEMSIYSNAFKPSVVNSLTSLDTLGIQRYHVIYR